jgi:hypothetical protein
MTEEELDLIFWHASRGCHFESTFLPSSNYAKQVIEEDVPALIREIRRLQNLLNQKPAKEEA